MDDARLWRCSQARGRVVACPTQAPGAGKPTSFSRRSAPTSAPATDDAEACRGGGVESQKPNWVRFLWSKVMKIEDDAKLQHNVLQELEWDPSIDASKIG